MIDYCGRLPKTMLRETVPGTYGTVIATLRHLVGADERYLAFMEGRPRRSEFLEAAKAEIATLRRAAEDHAASWERVLAVEPDPALRVTRPRPDGTPDTLTTRTLLVQAIHHGNDHRTHVCTVLGALGRRPPVLDAWHFYGED